MRGRRGSREPVSPATLEAGGHFFRMNGCGVRGFLMDEVPPVLAALLDRAGATAADVGPFVPHQANGVLLGEPTER